MIHVGLRVVRGPNWRFDDQDGGLGHVGTVTLPEQMNNCVLPVDTAFVTWDCGVIANYRIGHDGQYDLTVFDNSTKNVQHIFVTCDSCQQHGIIGMRWKCQQCDDFDLCSFCYMNDKHDLSHLFWRIDTPLSYKVDVPSRSVSSKIEAKGIFEGAKITRGPDWQWGDQDGGIGKEGVVTKVTGKDEYCWKNVIDVKWQSSSCNRYRLGHEGKIDVQYITEASGGYFYYDHLPKLGQYAPSPGSLTTGDKVRVDVTQERFEELHKGDGQWNETMTRLIGKVGTVVGLRNESDILVYFNFCKQTCVIKVEALTKIAHFKAGDIVEIISDGQRFEELQKDHGGWVSEMKEAVGKLGKVIHIHPTGDVRVLVSGHPWTLNPECCALASSQRLEEDSDGDDLISSADVFPDLVGSILQSVMERSTKSFDPNNVVHQCERGDVEAVRRLITLQPQQVNEMWSGKRALQAASFKGHLDVVNLLLESGADVNLADENGDTAMHVAALGNKPDIMKQLIKAGADLNRLNSKKHSALQIASNLGHVQCVEILVQQGCDVNLTDEDGDTALQDAIYKGRDEVVDLLLDSEKVDLSLRNRKTFSALHVAAFKGNVYATKKLVKIAHQLVNELTEEGHSALHIASINGYREIVEVLIDEGKCDLNVVNNRHHTALMLAVSEGRSSLIELLVTKGAKIDIQDTQGCTCLHMALGDHEMLDFSSFPMLARVQPRDLAEAPSIAKICLTLPVSLENRAWVGIACFLVENGSDMNTEDAKGRTPLSIARRNPLVAEVLEKHARQFEPTVLPECMMCLENCAAVTFQPCGHKIVCSECSVRMKKCFLCHVAIVEKITSVTPQRKSIGGPPASESDLSKSSSPTKSSNPPMTELKDREAGGGGTGGRRGGETTGRFSGPLDNTQHAAGLPSYSSLRDHSSQRVKETEVSSSLANAAERPVSSSMVPSQNIQSDRAARQSEKYRSSTTQNVRKSGSQSRSTSGDNCVLS